MFFLTQIYADFGRLNLYLFYLLKYMKYTIFLIFVFLIITTFPACEKKVKGCMHPRAQNFNPEADENDGCVYYPLNLRMQHYASPLSNDTLLIGNWLNDVDGEPFYITAMPILASGLHLFKGGTEYESPESIKLINASGTAVYVEDNFFITKPGVYLYNITGWADLGTFDSLRFYIGLPEEIRQSNPSKVTENQHPLSTTAMTYMYDSVSMGYQSCRLVAKQVNSGNDFDIIFSNYIPITLPCNITVVDGAATNIQLRLDYMALFNGISFSNDSPAVIQDKMVQNFKTAFSVY